MGKSKFGMYMILGAVIGGAASLLDKTTRENVIGKSKKAIDMVQYYSQNKDQLSSKIEEQKENMKRFLKSFLKMRYILKKRLKMLSS